MKFKIGDRVRVKDWEDITTVGFIKAMKYLCGKESVIIDIMPEKDWLFLKDGEGFIFKPEDLIKLEKEEHYEV